jgi:hypothetical protein
MQLHSATVGMTVVIYSITISIYTEIDTDLTAKDVY